MGASSCLVPLACFVLALAAVQAQKASKYKTCKRSMPLPELNECLIEALEIAFLNLAGGIPTNGIPPIDPLRVEKLVVPRGKGAVAVDITFKNLDVLGISHIKLKSLEVNKEELTMKFRQAQATFALVGDYEIDGKVLVLPITGNGRCNITIDRLTFDVDAKFKLATIKGKQYGKLPIFKMAYRKADKAYFDFENLFNGNKEFGDNMNLVLNDNWKEVLDEMVSHVFKAIEIALQQSIENMFSKMPFDKISPP